LRWSVETASTGRVKAWLLPLLMVAGGFVLLVGGAEGLVRGAATLALRLGLTPMVVGLTVVAIGTSAPELVVTAQATLAGQGDVAVGNVVGSNICNIGLILGLTALVYPVKVGFQLVKIDLPVMLVVSAVGVWVLLDGVVTRLEGGMLLVGAVAYVAGNVWLARRVATPEVEAEYAESMPALRGRLGRDLLWIGGGLIVLTAGSHLLVEGAVGLARELGVAEAVIGLTVVAVGTSLPELATSLVAAWKKEPDIAIGNVIGSNVFNLLGVLGSGAVLAPLIAPGVSHVDLGVALGLSVALLPLAWTGWRLHRWEGGVLLGTFAVYLWWLWP
jgi:cation:H+ antiporter